LLKFLGLQDVNVTGSYRYGMAVIQPLPLAVLVYIYMCVCNYLDIYVGSLNKSISLQITSRTLTWCLAAFPTKVFLGSLGQGVRPFHHCTIFDFKSTGTPYPHWGIAFFFSFVWLPLCSHFCSGIYLPAPACDVFFLLSRHAGLCSVFASTRPRRFRMSGGI